MTRAVPARDGAARGVGLGLLDENILDAMADSQPKANRYRESKFYEDGLTMQAPPAGTVPRERITLNPRVTTGREADGPIQSERRAAAGVRQATVPLPVKRKLLELGRKRYDITCGTCHGPLGDGDSIVATQMSLRPPPSLHRYAEKPAGYIYEVATKGFGLMASYAAELTVRGALGGRRLHPGAAAEPEHAGRRAARRRARSELEALPPARDAGCRRATHHKRRSSELAGSHTPTVASLKIDPFRGGGQWWSSAAASVSLR